MPKQKSNPLLAAFEAKKEAEFDLRLKTHNEINMLALLIAANEELQVGPGRSGGLLFEYIATKMQIAEDILEDSEADKTLTYTKYDIATRVKQILGKENWLQYRELFPLLREYWEE